MKGIRFYEEFANKRAGVSAGTVVAVTSDPFASQGDVLRECISALFAEPNSPVCGSVVSLKYLRLRCKRVSEARAREVHPALFDRLDQAETP